MKKIIILILLAITLVFSGYVASDPDSDPDTHPTESVIFTMKFKENEGWDTSGNEDWSRWIYDYQDKKKSFDLSDLLVKNQVYIFNYSFISNIDAGYMGLYFFNNNSGWNMITDWTTFVAGNKKNTRYSGKTILIPNEKAKDCNPENTFLQFVITDRSIIVPATFSFYEFSFEKMFKEPIGLNEWTISDNYKFKISDTTMTYAEIIDPYQGKNKVLHIRTAYNYDDYSDFVMQYDLNSYIGKKIKIEMSMDVYLKKSARIAWQINSKPTPFYPVVCGVCAPSKDHPDPKSGPAMTANKWINITGEYIYTVPNTEPSDDNGKQLYLSSQQIAGAEAYFANATMKITEVTP